MKAIRAAFTLIFASIPFTALAQGRAADFPQRPVKLIVPFSAGGTTDATGRILATNLERIWKQPVVVENQPGGNQLIGATNVSRAAPDGYTILLAAHSMAYEHLLNKDTTFNGLRDLTPIALTGGSGLIYSLAANVPAQSFQEFIAYAKANPNKVNEGTVGTTGIAELRGLWDLVGIQLTRVAYKGGVNTVTALAAGEVQVYGASPLDVLELSKAGKVRPVMYTEAQRHPQFPEVPTMKEVTGSDLTYRYWFGVFGPANMPADLVNRVSASVGETLRAPDVRERFTNLGLQIYGSTAADLRAELAARNKLISDLLAKGYVLR